VSNLLSDSAARNPEPFGALLEGFARQVAHYVVAELRTADCGGMLDQHASPLGSRRHCACVRARVAAGDPGAAIIGRRHLLSPEALGEELQATSTKTRKPAKPKRSTEKPATVREELEAELGALRLVATRKG